MLCMSILNFHVFWLFFSNSKNHIWTSCISNWQRFSKRRNNFKEFLIKFTEIWFQYWKMKSDLSKQAAWQQQITDGKSERSYPKRSGSMELLEPGPCRFKNNNVMFLMVRVIRGLWGYLNGTNWRFSCIRYNSSFMSFTRFKLMLVVKHLKAF